MVVRVRHPLVTLSLLGLAALGCGDSPRGETGQQHWAEIPLPESSDPRLRSADISLIANTVHLAIARETEPSGGAISVYRLAGATWEQLGDPVPTDARFSTRLVAIDGRPCVVGRRGIASRVHCVRDGAWSAAGRPIARNRSSDGTVFVSDASDTGRPTLAANGIVKPANAKGGAFLTGRTSTKLYTWTGSQWSRVRLPAAAASGHQRPMIAQDEERLCLAQSGPGGHVAIQCRKGHKWRTEPPVPRSAGARRVDVDGLALHDGRLCVGIDEFASSGVRWRVLCRAGSRWRATSLSPSSAWNQQGELLSRGGRLFALQFEQSPGPAGLQGRAQLRVAQAPASPMELSVAVLPETTLRGPISFDVETDGERIYALSAAPSTALGRHIPVLLHRQIHHQPKGAT